MKVTINVKTCADRWPLGDPVFVKDEGTSMNSELAKRIASEDILLMPGDEIHLDIVDA